MLFFVFSIVHGVIINENLSGDLQGVSVQSGDIYTLSATSQTQAAPSPSTPTLTMTGGQLTLRGNGNTVLVSGEYGAGYTGSVYFIKYSGGQFTLSSWNFDVRDSLVVALYTNGGSQVTVTSCTFTGDADQYTVFQNTNQVTLTDCTWKNIREQLVGPYYLEGFALTVRNCGQFTITKGMFANITAGEADLNTPSVTGYVAPVYITASNQATFTNTTFRNCSGLLAGAIFAYKTGSQNTYTNLVFADNKFSFDETQLLTYLNYEAGSSIVELTTFFQSATSLGNDITRVGPGSTPTVTDACSTSPAPHYRNGTSGGVASFSAQCPSDDTSRAWTVRAPFLAALLATAVAAFVATA